MQQPRLLRSCVCLASVSVGELLWSVFLTFDFAFVILLSPATPHCIALPLPCFFLTLQALRLHLSNTVPQPATVPPPPTHQPSKHKQGVAASGRRVAKTATAAASKRGGKAPAAKSKASDAFKEAKRARLASKAADAAAAGKKRRGMGRIGEKRAKEL